jgi:hypothetical protein
LVLKLPNPSDPITSGWALNIDLAPPYDGGGADLNYNIVNCNGGVMSIAQPAEQCAAIDTTKGCFGVQTGADVGNNSKGVDDLVARDPSASWSGMGGASSSGKVIGSDPKYTTSPRIVPVGVFDINLYLSQGYTGSNGIVKMVNIFGFFIEGVCKDLPDSALEPTTQPFCKTNGSGIVGRLMTFRGTNKGIVPNGNPYTFGATIQLVR